MIVNDVMRVVPIGSDVLVGKGLVTYWLPRRGMMRPSRRILAATLFAFSPSDGHLEEALRQELWSEIVGTF